MKVLVNLINEDLISKFSNFFSKPKFFGMVYASDENGRSKIGKKELNRIINKVNSIFIEDDSEILSHEDKFFLIFYNETFQKSESIFVSDRNHFRSVVISEKKIIAVYSEETTGLFKSDDVKFAINWSWIDHVELTSENKLCFFGKNSTKSLEVPIHLFCTNDHKTGKLIKEILNKINRYLTQMSNLVIERKLEIESAIKTSIEKLEFNKALSLLTDYSNRYNVSNINDSETSFYYLNKAISLKGVEDYDVALSTINEFIGLCDGENQNSPNAYIIQGGILFAKGDYLDSIACYSYSEEIFEDQENKRNAFSLKEYTYQKIKTEFVNIPYHKRKAIFITENIVNIPTNDLRVLKYNDVPNEIYFPIGHPYKNEVYACHPLKNNFYLPLNGFQEELFYDRVNEFTYLLQCLGATKIEISSAKEVSSNKIDSLEFQQNFELDTKFHGVNLERKKQSVSNNSNDSSIRIDKIQTFSPSKAPFIPESLVWFKTELSWQRLANQRLNGNINQHQETISSIQTEFISNHEINNIKAGVKVALAKVNFSNSNDYEININKNSKFEWRIFVDFANVEGLNLSDIDPSISKAIQNNMARYKEDVQLMLDDDQIIDDEERKILNKKILKYGLSPEEASIVESELLVKHYSKEELHYIDQVKEMVEEGPISDSKQKILERYAEKYNISNERRIAINSNYIK